MRPARPRAPIAAAVVIMFVWWVVAHNSGSGWVQAIGDAVFGMLLIGLIGPAAALWQVRVQMEGAPVDGAAGLPVTVLIRTKARVRIRPIEPPGTDAIIGPAGELTLLPRKRGVHQALLVEIGTAAPFGLQWWTRRAELPLASPLHIAPRLGEPLPIRSDQGGGNTGRTVVSQLGEQHSVRPYEPGDQRRGVHWPSTAHVGRLMVRELEEPSSEPLMLRVSLPADLEAAERVAERAMGTAVSLLDHGANLTMATDEQNGTVVRSVGTRREAGRRLARAVPAGGPARVEVVR